MRSASAFKFFEVANLHINSVNKTKVIKTAHAQSISQETVNASECASVTFPAKDSARILLILTVMKDSFWRQ